jgi:hypothetical protein
LLFIVTISINDTIVDVELENGENQLELDREAFEEEKFCNYGAVSRISGDQNCCHSFCRSILVLICLAANCSSRER